MTYGRMVETRPCRLTGTPLAKCVAAMMVDVAHALVIPFRVLVDEESTGQSPSGAKPADPTIYRLPNRAIRFGQSVRCRR